MKYYKVYSHFLNHRNVSFYGILEDGYICSYMDVNGHLTDRKWQVNEEFKFKGLIDIRITPITKLEELFFISERKRNADKNRETRPTNLK